MRVFKLCNLKFFLITRFVIPWIAIGSSYLIPFSNLNQGDPFLDSIFLILYSSILILLLNLKIQYYSRFLTIGKNCYFIYLFHMLFLYIFYKSFAVHFTSNIFVLIFSFLACLYAYVLSNSYLETFFRRSRSWIFSSHYF